jgi:ABC-type Zn2+ transport system substrate-binding protein/surface adhesin
MQLFGNSYSPGQEPVRYGGERRVSEFVEYIKQQPNAPAIDIPNIAEHDSEQASTLSSHGHDDEHSDDGHSHSDGTKHREHADKSHTHYSILTEDSMDTSVLESPEPWLVLLYVNIDQCILAQPSHSIQ